MRTVYPLLVATALVSSSSAAVINPIKQTAEIEKRQLNTNPVNQNASPNDALESIDPASLDLEFGDGYDNLNTGAGEALESIDPASLNVDFGDGYDALNTQPPPGPLNQPPSNRPPTGLFNRPANQPVNPPVNQPFNQPFNQPNNQPGNTLFNRPSNQPINPPFNQPNNRPGDGLFNRPGNQPFDQPAVPPFNQPNNQPGNTLFNRPANQPINPPFNQPNNRPGGGLFNRPGNQPNNVPGRQNFPGRGYGQPREALTDITEDIGVPRSPRPSGGDLPFEDGNTNMPGPQNPRSNPSSFPGRGYGRPRGALTDVMEDVGVPRSPRPSTGNMQFEDGQTNAPMYDRNTNSNFPPRGRPGTGAQFVDGPPSGPGRIPSGNRRMPFPGEYNQDLEFEDGKFASPGGYDNDDGNMPFSDRPAPGLDFEDGTARDNMGQADVPYDIKDGPSNYNPDMSPDFHDPYNSPPFDDLNEDIGHPRTGPRKKSSAACRKGASRRGYGYDEKDFSADDMDLDSFCDAEEYLSDDDLPFPDGCDADGFSADGPPNCRNRADPIDEIEPGRFCDGGLHPPDGSKSSSAYDELCRARHDSEDSCSFDRASDDPNHPCTLRDHRPGEQSPCGLDGASPDPDRPFRSCDGDHDMEDEPPCLRCNPDELDEETKLKINIYLNGKKKDHSHPDDKPYPVDDNIPYDAKSSSSDPDVPYDSRPSSDDEFYYERPHREQNPFETDSLPGVPNDLEFDDGTNPRASVPDGSNIPSAGARPSIPFDDGNSSPLGVPSNNYPSTGNQGTAPPYTEKPFSSGGSTPYDGNSIPSGGSSPAPQPYNPAPPPPSSGGTYSAPQPPYNQSPPPSGGSYSAPPQYSPKTGPSSGGGGYVHQGQTPAVSPSNPFTQPGGRGSGKRKCRARYKVKSKAGERPDFPEGYFKDGRPSGTGYSGAPGSGGGQCGFISPETIALLKGEEGFVATVTSDPRGHGTIGYGHKCIENGCAEVPYSQPLSEADAEKLMLDDLEVRLQVHIPPSSGSF